VNQILTTRLRALSLERDLRDHDELEERLAELKRHAEPGTYRVTKDKLHPRMYAPVLARIQHLVEVLSPNRSLVVHMYQ
jgi:hypothetical protein